MKPPDRWLKYTAIGSIIANSNFVAFKVPLHQHVCQRLPSPERHTTNDVINALPRLGIVINLTATQTDSKYYQPNDWKRFGVEYKWLRTEGRVTPSQSSLIQFCQTVKKFLMANPEKLVGVHCTHGLNRTGYFVCSYLVLCNNLSPTEALKNFADARGHQIERPNYVTAIMKHQTDERLKRAIENGEENERSDRSKRHSRHRISTVEPQISQSWRRAAHYDASRSREDNNRGETSRRGNEICQRDFSQRRGSNFGPRVGPVGNIVRPNSHNCNTRSQDRTSRWSNSKRETDSTGWDEWRTRRMRK